MMQEVLAAPVYADLEDYVEAYEHAHEANGSASIDDFLPPPHHPLYQEVLCELIRADLEYGWHRGQPTALEEYRRRFPAELSDPDILTAIAFEEYRIRRRLGYDPSRADYARRYSVDVNGWPEENATAGAANEQQPARYTARTAGAETGGDLPASLSLGDGLEGAQRRNHLHLDSEAPHARSVDSWRVLSALKTDQGELFPDVPGSAANSAVGLAPASPALPKVGTEFLGFRLVDELGKGAFGTVFLAKQGGLADRYVVLKVAADIDGESLVLAQLQHTNIVPIYSVHRAGSLQAICMPYFGSTTLAHVLRGVQAELSLPVSGKFLVSTVNGRKASTRVPPSSAGSVHARDLIQPGVAQPEGTTLANVTGVTENWKKLEHLTYSEAVLWLGARLADGLAHAHERGILHRDLKPANVLLTDDGQPMLLDFNLSSDTKSARSVADASIGGTLPYMAPEHLDAFRGGPGRADTRSDLFSLGVILYELLTGRQPYPTRPGKASSVLELMIADRHAPLPSLRRLHPGVSPAIEAILGRCLHPEPARRYQRAADLREDIERQLANLPLKHTREPSHVERCRKWVRRHPRLTSLTSVGLILGTLLLMLTVAFTVRGQNLAHLQALDTLGGFHDQMRTTQFLLYSRHSDRKQLEEGMTQCRATLGQYRVLEDPNWTRSPEIAALPQDSQNRLREEVGELLFLLGKATMLYAQYHAEPSEYAANLHRALGYSVAAASCYGDGRVPRALWEQRSRISSLLGNAGQASEAAGRAKLTPLRVDKDYYLIAHEHVILGNYRQALEWLRKATQQDPRNFSAWFVRGNCYYELVQDADAVGCFNTCVALRPDFHWSWYNRGLAHLRLRNYQQAVDDFTAALHVRADLTDALVGRARAYEGLKQYPSAVSDLTLALESKGSPTRLYFLRAEARDKAGDPAGARADMERGLLQKPTDEASWIARGLARKDADPTGALADFDAALKVNPRSFEGLQNKAAILVDKFGRDRDALHVMDEAVRLYPDSVLARGGRGVLLARAGKSAAARTDGEQALLLDTQPPTLYQVACIYALTSRQRSEDRLKAIELLAASLRAGFGLDWVATDPDLAPIRQLAEFRRAVGAARSLQQETRMRPREAPAPHAEPSS